PATSNRIFERLKKHESFTEEVVYYSKNGHKYWMRLDISPVIGVDDQLNHFITIQTDISSQKEFESQITNIARDLSNLIENANVPILGIDRNGYINEWNRNAAELTEYSKNDVLEKKLITLVELTVEDDLREIINKVLMGESTRNYQLPFVNKSGSRLILLVSISPRLDVNKNIHGAICVGQDITELIHYREGLERMVEERTSELNEALQKEKELVELKSKFVSIASHEFRTPLSTISLITGLLHKHREKITTDDYHTKLDTVEKQVKHMTFLLDDILIIGKADAGKILTSYTSVSIEQFFTLTAREVEQNAPKFKIKLLLKCTVKEFQADEKLLRNILTNLLTNAIKFSTYIHTVYLNVTNTADYLKFEVEDRGMGISEEDMPNLFTAFHRGGNVGTIQGTGLGLSIVKKAVELLKGEIKVNSKVGKGTTITILLPLKVK
ncbi:MAG: PAS domain-containing sensor histidine kinase, partial [Marivirga sp.]|nr:PAS domain-containing sensor histidine kinase [Marivirga sp.]